MPYSSADLEHAFSSKTCYTLQSKRLRFGLEEGRSSCSIRMFWRWNQPCAVLDSDCNFVEIPTAALKNAFEAYLLRCILFGTLTLVLTLFCQKPKRPCYTQLSLRFSRNTQNVFTLISL